MSDLKIRYEDHKGKYIYCIRNDKSFGIRKGKGYKILEVEENQGDYFYKIMTEKANITMYENGIAFNSISKSFLNVEDSQAKLRELKLERILGGTIDQLFYTDETK